MFIFSPSTFLTFAMTLLTLTSVQQLHAKNALQVRIDPLVQPYLDNETVMGLTIEWHLDLLNSFQNIEFGFVSWFHHVVVLLESSFAQPWFKPIWAICDWV